MALGAAQAAITRARLTGQPVPIGTAGLVAYPNGSIGTPGGGFRPMPAAAAQQPVAPSTPFNAAGVQGLPGSPSGPAVAPPPWSVLQRPSAITNQPVGSTITAPQIPTLPAMPAVDDYGRVIAPFNQQQQAPLNQANPNFTAGIQGLPGSPSGPAVAPPGGFPPSVPEVTVTAKRYRQAHGLAADDDSAATDALNAESLAAARAGRTSFNPQLAAQYGQAPAAGVYGPRTDVVNALAMPAAGGGQPIMLAPTTAVAVYPSAAQRQANALLQQGTY